LLSAQLSRTKPGSDTIMPIDFDGADNQHRSPLGKTQAPSGKPLIVSPTFVSRVDDTPRGDRPQDSGSAKSPHGHEVHLPNWRAGALGLGGDPNRAFEHWDEYWRKVHGPKFAWNEPGSSSELVVRYDQLHRIASGPSSGTPLPYRAMIDEHGLLPSDPWKRVPEFRRPRWGGSRTSPMQRRRTSNAPWGRTNSASASSPTSRLPSGW
jgi:hypothetical protein